MPSVGQVAHARDVLDALRTALAEARRHLKAAQEAVRAKERTRALERAAKSARARLEAASMLDELFLQLDQHVGAFHAAGRDMAQHLRDAGRPVPSQEKLTASYALRGAVMRAAPTFASVVALDRINSPDHRIPLRDHIAVQVSPLLSKGKTA